MHIPDSIRRAVCRGAVLSAAAFTACDGPEDPQAAQGTDQVGAPAPVWHPDDNPILSMVEARGRVNEALHGLRAALLLPRGRLVVSQTGPHHILYFDSLGNAIRGVGAEGEGPGEFSSAPSLFYAGTRIMAWNTASHYHASLFTRTGDLSDETTLPLGPRRRAIGWMEGVGPVTTAAGYEKPGTPRSYSIWRKEGDIAGELSGPPEYPRGSIEYIREIRGRTMPVTSTGLSGVCVPQQYGVTYGDRLLLVDGGRGEISAHTIDGARDIIYRSEDRMPATAQLLQDLRHWLNERNAFPDRPDSLDAVLEGVGMPNGQLPAWHHVVSDPTGRLWLLRARCDQILEPGSDGPSVWDVVSIRDGALVAQATLPREWVLLAAREERVAILRFDTLGVEHLEIYDVLSSDLGPGQAGDASGPPGN